MKILLFVYLSFFLTQISAQAKSFHVRLSEDLGTLDWNYGEVNHEIIDQIMEGLFTTDSLGRPQTALAQKFQWNKDKTKLSLSLEEGKLWSDGVEVCAQHFVDSWQRLQSKEFASPYAHYARPLKSYKANGCYKLEVEFHRPTPEALALFSHYVFFPIRLEALKNEKIFLEGVGLPVTGAYKVKEWKKNRKIVLEKNAEYDFAKPAVLSEITFSFIGEDSTALALFDKGEIDWLKELPQLLRSPEREASVEFRRFPALVVFYFGLNAGASKALENPIVREALSQALHREELRTILGKEYRPTESWLIPEVFPALKMGAQKKYDFAPAQKLLQDLAKEGKMDIKLRVYAKAAHKQLAEWTQGQWEKNLGIRIPIEVQEGKVYWKELSVSPPPLFLSGVTAPYNHPRAFLQEFLSDSSANWTSWRSVDYDRFVAEEKIAKAEELLRKQGFVIPLYARDTIALVKKQWKGFSINPLGQIFLKNVR